VNQGYSLADTEGMTVRQLFHFARLALERLEAVNRALKAGHR
jgi:hypothetical protein